jgi:hypothetical protein
MIVVSWTGNEVECYAGERISSRLLANALNLQGWSSFSFAVMDGRRGFNRVFLVPVFAAAFAALAMIGVVSTVRSAKRPPAVAVFNAAASTLPVGASGVLRGTHYQIAAQALVEISEMGLRLQRHEYSLRDDDGGEAVLMDDPRPTTNWFLCAPLHPEHPLTPQQAARLGGGQTVILDDRTARLTELFRCTVRESGESGPGSRSPGDVSYGFVASTGSDFLLARWNATNISWYEAKPLPASVVLAALGPSAGK